MKSTAVILALCLIMPALAHANGGPKGNAAPLAHVVNLQVVGSNTGATTFPGNAATFVYNDAVNNLALLPNVEAGSTLQAACSAGAQAWEDVSLINFTDGGTTTTQDANGADGINLITFVNSTANNAAVGSALAVALTSFNSSLQVTDADIVFNSSVMFSTLGSATFTDVQSVATHEYGHTFGLNHSASASATMFPFTSAGRIHQRTLNTDDIAGINSVYQTIPNFWSTGAISGTITQGGVNVYGAHVVARSLVDGTTQASAMSLSDGTYTISGLRAGPYTIYVEPLDGPVGDSNVLSTVFTTGKNTSFQTTVLGGAATPTPVRVEPGTLTSGVNVAVSTSAPTRNLIQIGDYPTGTGSFSVTGSGFEKAPGDSTFVVIAGPGVDTIADSAFSMAGHGISFGPNSTNSGTLSSGTGYKIFPLNIAADAEPGPRDVVLNDGSEIAIYCGVIDITPAATVAKTFSFGTGSNGTAGVPSLAAVGTPTINNPSFALAVSNGVNGETAYFFGAARPDYIDLGNGITQWLRIPQDDLFPTDGFNAPVVAGVATLSFPIPNLPSISGLHIYMQCGLSDAAVTGGISSSNGLVIVFQ